MKIAYLSHSPLTAPVANAVHVVQMCSAFASNGHDVSLYARGVSTAPYARGVPVGPSEIFETYGVAPSFNVILSPRGPVRVLRRVSYGLRQAYRAKSLDDPDIFYARCLASAAFALWLGGEVVLEVHEVPRSRLERRIQRSVLKHRRLRRAVVITRALLEDLQRAYPRVLNRVDCVVAPDAASTSAQTTPFELERGAGRQIGYAGGMRSGNGVQLILDLAEARRDDTFHMLGGTPEDVRQWNDRQKSGNIIWYGRREPGCVPGFLAACDILLAPYEAGPKTNTGRDTSRWMSPLKIFEYMASGTPMVVSDFPVLREVLSEDIAEIAAPSNLEAWMQSLDRLGDERAREQLAARAFDVFKKHYTWEARARNVLEGLDASPRLKRPAALAA